ncbi:hypothetical protein U1Q18_050330, partial [Sarracenia purpurea var. burkii]
CLICREPFNLESTYAVRNKVNIFEGNLKSKTVYEVVKWKLHEKKKCSLSTGRDKGLKFHSGSGLGP